MVLSYQKQLKGEKVGVVFGSFAPLHQGHLDEIMRAKKENDGGCIVIVCGYDGDKGEPLMPHKKRYRYVREFFADDDLVGVYAINDTELGLPKYPNGWEGWMEEFERIFDTAVIEPNYTERVWYVGEKEYYNDLVNMQEEVILLDRTENLISATMIRNNPIKHWNKITFPFKRVFSTNILICGTASEGKSTLTADLGKYFNTTYSTEYARDYMRESCVTDSELDGADFMAFLNGQYQLNKEKINSQSNNGIFFADSDALVTNMYANYYSKDETCALTLMEYEKIKITAYELTKKSKWDKIYLLCPLGKFVDDHERYMAHSEMAVRQELFEILCQSIKDCGLWDKVEILNLGYYGNFKKIVEDMKGIIEK